MTNLTTTLRNETQTLKVQYISKTIEWATDEYNKLKEFANNYSKGVYGFKNGELEKKYYKLPYYIINSNGDVQNHIDKMVKIANDHYETSINKLADRILKKGLNQNNIKVETSHIGVNIETVLTDGIKTVKAFTVLAWGEIQKPHYRYLIK